MAMMLKLASALALGLWLVDAAAVRKVAGPPASSLLELAKDAQPTCESCKWVVKTLKCEIEDPDTQAELLSMLTNQFCPSLPADLSAQCVQLAPALVPGALWYLDTFSASELCADVSLCGSAPATPLQAQALGLKAAAANSSCAMCSYLRASEGSDDVICASLPEALQPACRTVASAAGDKGCGEAGLCPPAWAAGAGPLALPPALVGGLAQGLLAKQARTALGGTSLGDDYQLCDICKSIVAEAAVILSNPDTQKQALAYAEAACASLGDLQNQCLSYVELYGPLALNIVVQYLNQEACAKIGYCPAAAARLHAGGRGLILSA